MVSKEHAFEIALENRKFEIELYWKRAKYFFDAFIALGGISILISVLQTSKAINLPLPIFFTILFAVECIGLLASKLGAVCRRSRRRYSWSSLQASH